MKALQPEVLLPAMVSSSSRCEGRRKSRVAAPRWSPIRQILALINQGRSPDEISCTPCRRPLSCSAKPYLLPKYDNLEFAVRSIWHLCAGWFDGDPAHLKPAAAAELAAELAALARGENELAERAKTLAGRKTRLAAHLIKLVSTASPTSADIQAVRARVYARCTSAEASWIGKAIFDVYRWEAEARSSE